jgi:hypothetical protein
MNAQVPMGRSPSGVSATVPALWPASSAGLLMADQAQPPPLEEPPELPPDEAPADVLFVIPAPDGETSHHLAPNEVLPSPVVMPALWSAR